MGEKAVPNPMPRDASISSKIKASTIITIKIGVKIAKKLMPNSP